MRRSVKVGSLLMLSILSIGMIGCGSQYETKKEKVVKNNTVDESKTTVKEELLTDAKVKSSDGLIGTTWERSTGSCTEVISFPESGEFVYYEVCGNPVHNSDCYQTYSYDEKTGVITAYSLDENSEIYDTTSIKVIEFNEEKLVLSMEEDLGEGTKEFIVYVEERTEE